MKKKYGSYNAAQLLDDAFFIEWIKHPTPEAENFWTGFINSNPPNLIVIKEAALQLRTFLSAKRIEAENGDAEEVWEKLQQSILKPVETFDKAEKRTGGSNVKPMHRTWWAAAAVVLVLVTGGYFFWTQITKNELASIETKQPSIENDIAPGGNKAILTLADGTQLVLDSANNGAISKQGNVTVIKMEDGQLAYNNAGEVTNEVLYNTISTPKGGQYQLILVDGTKVWLNAASSLRFPTAFNGNERVVEITGEGYFEVAHNKQKPFHVKVNEMEVQVLGTHFNVNAYLDEDAIKTTLLEGIVKVKLAEKSTLLKPGQQARLNSDQKLQTLNNIDLEQVIAWKNGYFSFDNANIQTIMRQLSRWYDIEVTYEGDITNQKFSGKVYRNMSLQKVLEVLSFSQINIKMNGKKLVVASYE